MLMSNPHNIRPRTLEANTNSEVEGGTDMALRGRNSVPDYLNGWEARDHESQQQTRSQSILSKKVSEERSTSKGIDSARLGFQSTQAAAQASNAKKALESAHQPKETDKGQAVLRNVAFTEVGSLNGIHTVANSRKPSSDLDTIKSNIASSSLGDSLQSSVTRSLSAHGVASLTVPREASTLNAAVGGNTLRSSVISREQSYSPPPATSPSNESSTSKAMSRKCTNCGRTIFSAMELCTKCQSTPVDKELPSKSTTSGVSVLPSIDTKSHPTTDHSSPLPSQLERKSSLTLPPAVSPKRRRNEHFAEHDHIFVPSKRARQEYVPPKDSTVAIQKKGWTFPKAKGTAKKSASNVCHLTNLPPFTNVSVNPSDDVGEILGVDPPTDIPMKSTSTKDTGIQTVEQASVESYVKKAAADQDLLEKRLREASLEAVQNRTLEQQLKASRRQAVEAQRLIEESRQEKDVAQKAEKKLAERLAKLEIQRKKDVEEIQRLRNTIESRQLQNNYKAAVSGEHTLSRNKELAGKVAGFESLSPETHRYVLEAKGVIFESDSNSDSPSPELPTRTVKQQPRRPLWQRLEKSKDLFEVAPQYLQENVISNAFIEAKKREIALRPRRKQTFGRTLPVTKRVSGLDPHQQVDRQREERPMIVTVSRDMNVDSMDETNESGMAEFDIAFQDEVSMPKQAKPFMIEGQLAFRDGTTLREGRMTRAKDIFRVGP